MNRFADEKKTCLYLGHLTPKDAQEIIKNQYQIQIDIMDETETIPESRKNITKCILNLSPKSIVSSSLVATNLFGLATWRNLINRTHEFINVEAIKWDISETTEIKWKFSIGFLSKYFCRKLPEGQTSAYQFVYLNDTNNFDTLSLYRKLYTVVTNTTTFEKICFNESMHCLNKLFSAIMLSFDLAHIMANIKNQSIDLELFTKLEAANLYANQRSCRPSSVFKRKYSNFIDIGM